MILLGAVFSAVLGFMQSAPIMGIAVGVFSAGYFGAFYLSIVETTIGGRETSPDWPSFTSFIDDILMPYLRLLGLCLISFAPLHLGSVVALIAAFAISLTIEELGANIPYASVFITAAVGLYFMMFQGRIIGLIYERKREELGWE